MAKYIVYRTLTLEVEADDEVEAEDIAGPIHNSEWTDSCTDFAEQDLDDDFDDEDDDYLDDDLDCCDDPDCEACD